MKTLIIALLITAAMPVAAFGAATSPDPIVQTDRGSVRGVAVDDALIFRDIPFAAPPVGSLRWMPTAPAASWSGIRDASHFGAICPQPSDPRRAGYAQSEDCLTINIAAPKAGVSGKLPVLFLIHGGAYFVGTAADGFDAAAATYTRRGIVVVAANYRLGRLGFFAHPGLRAEQPGGSVANYWLMDQVAALQWVKRNIAAFGGDPAQVTILGCSAGGSSVNALMASPKARGLFARASAHSGGGINNATRPLARAENEGLAFAERAGVQGQGADAVARLRRLDVAAVLAADPGAPNFGAMVDGRYLTEETAVAFARGDIAHVPFIAGSTSNEASVFGLMGFDEKVLKDRFGIDFAEVQRVYDPAGKLAKAEVIRQVQTDFIFTSGATALAALAGKWQPSYAFHFAFVPQADEGKVPGAPHCADMPYILGSADAGGDAEQVQLAEMMQDYSANFIKTGNPNGEGLMNWPRYTGPDYAPLLIDHGVAPMPAFRKAQLDYWHDLWSKRTGEAYPR